MAKGSTDEVESQVLYELRGDAAWIIINRPEKRNAMTGPMRERIMALLHESERNDAVRAIVFTGSGEHFTSGADLSLAYAKYQEHEAKYQPREEGQEERKRTSLRTRLFVERLQALDLLIPRVLEVVRKDQAPTVLQGFSVVDEGRLLALGDTQLLELARSGFLAWIYAHLMSLGNVQELAALVDARLSAAASAQAVEPVEPVEPAAAAATTAKRKR